MSYDLLVVGELNADLLLVGDVTPAFGQAEKLIDDATLTMGSSAAIMACGAARLGLRVALAAKVGDDDLGRILRRELEARGVDPAGVVADPALKTGLTVIFSRGDDRAMLTYPGAIPRLRRADIAPALIGAARHLHLSSFYLLDDLRPAVPALFADARRAGLTTSLDTNYDPSGQWAGGVRAALAEADIFLPNLAELRAIAGAEDVDAALEQLAAGGATVAAKLGPAGGIARRGAQTARAESPAVRVVDTTGAGDTFDAGLIYGQLAGWELERSLRMACACGALSTRAMGGTAAQPTIEEALAYLA